MAATIFLLHLKGNGDIEGRTANAVLVMIFGAVAGVIGWYWLRWFSVRKHVRQRGYQVCPRCGYELPWSSDRARCPECGESYCSPEVVARWHDSVG